MPNRLLSGSRVSRLSAFLFFVRLMKKGKKGFLRNAYARSSITSSPAPTSASGPPPASTPSGALPPAMTHARAVARALPPLPPARASARSRAGRLRARAPAYLSSGNFSSFSRARGGLAGVRIRIRFRRPTLRLRLGSVVARRVSDSLFPLPTRPSLGGSNLHRSTSNLDRLPPVVRVRLRELVPKLGEHRRRRRAKGPRRVPLDVRARAGLVQTVHRVAREHEPRAQKPEVRAAPPRPERGFMMAVSARSARNDVGRSRFESSSVSVRSSSERRHNVVSCRSRASRASTLRISSRVTRRRSRATSRGMRASASAGSSGGRTRRSSPGSSPARSGRGPAR